MKPLVAHFIGGPHDPSTCRVAGCLPKELRFPSFHAGLLRTECVYTRSGSVRELSDRDEATYHFDREVITHGG